MGKRRSRHGRGRLFDNWKFRVTKKMLHRAQEFERRARTWEEMKAWREVQKWFTDVMSQRHMTPSGAMGLDYEPDGPEERSVS